MGARTLAIALALAIMLPTNALAQASVSGPVRIVIINITEEQPPGGGGGGGKLIDYCGNGICGTFESRETCPEDCPTENVTCGHYVALTIPFLGFNATTGPGARYAEFKLGISNWEVPQRFHGNLSGGLDGFCEMDQFPREPIPVRGFGFFSFRCRVDYGTVSGNFTLTTDTGCRQDFPVRVKAVSPISTTDYLPEIGYGDYTFAAAIILVVAVILVLAAVEVRRRRRKAQETGDMFF